MLGRTHSPTDRYERVRPDTLRRRSCPRCRLRQRACVDWPAPRPQRRGESRRRPVPAAPRSGRRVRARLPYCTRRRRVSRLERAEAANRRGRIPSPWRPIWSRTASGPYRRNRRLAPRVAGVAVPRRPSARLRRSRTRLLVACPGRYPPLEVLSVYRSLSYRSLNSRIAR